MVDQREVIYDDGSSNSLVILMHAVGYLSLANIDLTFYPMIIDQPQFIIDLMARDPIIDLTARWIESSREIREHSDWAVKCDRCALPIYQHVFLELLVI